MHKNLSAAIPLLGSGLAWYKPLLAFRPITYPGINYLSIDAPVCSDPLLHWVIAWVFQEGHKSWEVTLDNDCTKYMSDLTPTYPSSTLRH